MAGGKHIPLPKGRFEPPCEDESCGSRKMRGESIWEGAQGEFGWLPVSFVSSAALDWSLAPTLWSGGGGSTWSLHSLQQAEDAQAEDGASLACCGSGLAFTASQRPRVMWQWRVMAWQGRLPSCRRKARPGSLPLPEDIPAAGPWDAPGWIWLTVYLFSFCLLQNTFATHWIFSDEIRMPYPMYVSWNNDNKDVWIGPIFWKKSWSCFTVYISSCMSFWARQKSVQICISIS